MSQSDVAAVAAKGQEHHRIFRGRYSVFGDMINGLPRKILGYCTPEQLLEQHFYFVYAI